MHLVARGRVGLEALDDRPRRTCRDSPGGRGSGVSPVTSFDDGRRADPPVWSGASRGGDAYSYGDYRIVGILPAFDRLRKGKEPVAPKQEGSTAYDFLYLLMPVRVS